MFSRYDAMTESAVKDSEDQLNYADTLSLNMNNLQLTEIPRLRTLSKVDIDRFWLFILKMYAGASEGDDVVLAINGIPYLGMMEPGSQIYLPNFADISSVKKLAGVP
mgnify:CR=1 FL=1